MVHILSFLLFELSFLYSIWHETKYALFCFRVKSAEIYIFGKSLFRFMNND